MLNAVRARWLHSTFDTRCAAFLISLYALIAILVFPVFPHFSSPNEVTRWLLVAAVAEDHTLEVTKQTSILSPGFEDLAVVGQRVYSNKAPGVALAAAPGYLLARPFAGPPSRASLRLSLTAMRWFGATLPLVLMAQQGEDQSDPPVHAEVERPFVPAHRTSGRTAIDREVGAAPRAVDHRLQRRAQRRL